ncbi:MAG: hypothetical protein PVH61_13145 [Candidatus Aminicenantes bacterium]|jgi:hypothetical protein
MIREIRRAENEELVIKIPSDYVYRDLEILIFPIPHDDSPLPPAITQDAAKNLKKFRLLVAEAEKSNIRIPDGVDIDDLIDEINDQ